MYLKTWKSDFIHRRLSSVRVYDVIVHRVPVGWRGWRCAVLVHKKIIKWINKHGN